MTERVSAVLFAQDLGRMLDFYCAVLGQPCVYRDKYHAVLRCGIFALDIHQVPLHAVDARPQQRELAAVKLSFPVASIAQARALAQSLGGELDPGPPRWVIEQQRICDGRDPEGNVFQLREND